MDIAPVFTAGLGDLGVHDQGDFFIVGEGADVVGGGPACAREDVAEVDFGSSGFGRGDIDIHFAAGPLLGGSDGGQFALVGVALGLFVSCGKFSLALALLDFGDAALEEAGDVDGLGGGFVGKEQFFAELGGGGPLEGDQEVQFDFGGLDGVLVGADGVVDLGEFGLNFGDPCLAILDQFLGDDVDPQELCAFDAVAFGLDAAFVDSGGEVVEGDMVGAFLELYR